MILNWSDIISADAGYNFYYGGWVKRVDSIDDSKANGYAFIGDFVRRAITGFSECHNGFYLVCSIEGGRRGQVKKVSMWQVSGAHIERVTDWVSGEDWALKLRLKAQHILAEADGEAANPLSGFTTEQLLAELKRRKAKDTDIKSVEVEALAELLDTDAFDGAPK